VFVQDQQIAWGPQAPEQREGNVMEISGAKERQERPRVAGCTSLLLELCFERTELAPTAAQTYVRRKGAKVYRLGRHTT
jgi:hypothetical protein